MVHVGGRGSGGCHSSHDSHSDNLVQAVDLQGSYGVVTLPLLCRVVMFWLLFLFSLHVMYHNVLSFRFVIQYLTHFCSSNFPYDS